MGRKHQGDGDGVSKEKWRANFAEVTVYRGRTVYRPNRKAELPELLQTQVIASRDPRLSPSLPNTSVYSRDFDIDDDGYGFDDDGSGSFNSEDWYMDEVSGDFEEEAKKVKVKVHVNPKFLGKEDEQSKVKDVRESPKEGATKEKVKSWLQDSVKEKERGEESAPESVLRRRKESPDGREKERVKESPQARRSPREPQKSIAMFPDESQQKRSLSPMFSGSLFPHIKPLKTKDFGKKWESKESERSRQSATPQSPVRDRYESRRPQSPVREYTEGIRSPIRDIPSEPSPYIKPRSTSPYSSTSKPRSPQSRKSHSSVRSRSPVRSPVRSPSPPPGPPRIASPEPVPMTRVPPVAPIPTSHPMDPVPPSEQWTNRSEPEVLPVPHSICCLRPLSGYAKRSNDCLLRPSILDRLIDSHRRDVFMELDHVCRGRKQSKYDQAWKHLPSLSMETQLESTFAESAMVKRVYLATLREWMSSKPLDNLLRNPTDVANTEKPLPIRSSLKTDATLKQCQEQFEAEIYHMSRGGRPVENHENNVYPKPMNATEETVDEVYRQVHQYMNFVNKKALNSGHVAEKPNVELISPVKSISPVPPVPEPVQAPFGSPDTQHKSRHPEQPPTIPAALAYSPSRPTGQEEDDDEEDESQSGKKRRADPRTSPAKKHKSDEKKAKKKDKKHKKDKKKEKAKKAKKKRKESKSLNEEEGELIGAGLREDPQSESSGSESPQSTRQSESIESPTKETHAKFSEKRFTESREKHHEERRRDHSRDERHEDRSNGKQGERDEHRQDDRHEEERSRDRSDGDRDRHKNERDREAEERSGRNMFRSRGYRQSDAYVDRRMLRERRIKCTNVMQHCMENILAMKSPEETVLETTVATWKMYKDITHTEASFVTKHLVDAAKHLSRDFEPEKGFNWALILAIHSQVMQDVQDRLTLEEASAAASKAEQELEEGELEASPSHESIREEIPKPTKEDSKSKMSASKAGGHGNKLIAAFRQQMAAKKREELGIVNKVEVAKLSPAAAAKKPKPSSSRPLFKPPAAFEMLKAAQEERDRQKSRRGGTDAKEELRFDGMVREGLVADALKSFFHLTEDVLQLFNAELASDFIEYVMPVALSSVHIVKKFLGLAATIVIVVKEKREKDKLRMATIKAELDVNEDSGSEKFEGEIRATEDEEKEEGEGLDGDKTKDKKEGKEEPSSKKEDSPSQADTTVVDMEMDDDDEVNEYGTVVNEYGTVVEEKKDELPKLKTPIKLTGTQKKLIKPGGLVASALDDDETVAPKRKLELLSDDEDSAPKKSKDEKSGSSKGSDISKDKMEGVEKIDFEDADSTALQQKLQRMQTGAASRQVAADRISAIVSEGPKDEADEAPAKSEDGKLVFQKFTPVPEQANSEETKQEQQKKTVVESVISVKGKPPTTTASPLTRPVGTKLFKNKGWGSAPKVSCTATQKVSAQDILARLQSKAESKSAEEQKQPDKVDDASKSEVDELYQAALSSTSKEETSEIPIPAPLPAPLLPDELPPLPPPKPDELPPLPTEPPVMKPPPIPKLLTAKSAEEFKSARTTASGVVAQAAPKISKPRATGQAFPMPDISQPPPPIPAETGGFPGKFQQYPPPPDDATTPAPPGQPPAAGNWGEYNAQGGYGYNANQHWDGTQWVTHQGNWPPPTWQPPPNAPPPPASGAWPPPTTSAPPTSWPNSWPPPSHAPPPHAPPPQHAPPPHAPPPSSGTWGWQQSSAPAVSARISESPKPSNKPRSKGLLPTPGTEEWSELPPGEEPPVPPGWPAWKQPRPPGTDPAPPGEGKPAVSGSHIKSPVPKAKPKPEWKKPPFPIRLVLPSPNRMRVYVFNREKPICKTVDTFLSDMGVEKFDPYTVSSLQYQNNVEAAAVLIHKDDTDKIHLVPNLYTLKNTPKVKFVTYFDANDVSMQKFSVVLPSGGLLVADDSVLLALQPAALKEVCRYMLNAAQSSKDPVHWTLVIHSHIADKLNARKHELSNTSAEVLRITSLLETIDQFRNERVVDILHSADPQTERPAHEYLSSCVRLQAERAAKHRHCFLLSDVRMSNEKSAQFTESGIGVISVPDFLDRFAGKPIPAPMVAVPKPNYGKRGSPVFDDVALSSGTQQLDVEKVPPAAFTALEALKDSSKQTEPSSPSTPAAARLGEVVRPDANVRPSPGRYDVATAGPGRWMMDEKAPGM